MEGVSVARKLRAVGEGDAPSRPAPKTLLEATQGTRRELLVMARRKIATEVDLGVPAHTLGRLIAELDRLDGEIRQLDVRDRGDAAEVVDVPFNASAI